MSAHSNAAPVIIKRKKVVAGGGHHGGAWKVAYADFVTAMMAFFLLMWLLNATTEQQRKGISDYFSPTIPINRISGGGDGSFGGDSVFSEDTLPQNGTGASQAYATSQKQARGSFGALTEGAANADAQAEAEAFASIEAALAGRSGESMVADTVLRHILTRVTDEGLVIEVFDLAEARLFEPQSTTPTPLLQDIATLIASTAALVENNLALEAFTRARPVIVAENPVWDLSSARANTMRKMLEGNGIDAKRMHRITGHADRKPVVTNPMAVRNNRLEVILLRSDRR
ncbi:MAG: flagellar motor protein MotB [Roseovarius sp.]|nr:flagellar motor protein MotB [Roseovarius sp.]